MSDLERRLRAAMIAAAEPPPANLVQEVRCRHRRHVRRVSLASAAVVAALAIATPPVAHALRTGPHQPGPHQQSQNAPTTVKPTGRTGSSCQPDVGALPANWRDSSVQAGPIWFAYARTQGYVHLSGSPGAPRGAHQGTGQLAAGVMIVEVGYGSRVTLTVAPAARTYFRLLNGFPQNGGSYSLADGLDTMTLTGCPQNTPPGDNGRVSDYYLGFVVKIGSAAPADVATSASARPIQVLFTCQRSGCNT